MAGLLPWQNPSSGWSVPESGLANSRYVKLGLLEGEIERSLIYRDEKTGVWLKSRPDVLPTSSRIVADLKTTTSQSPDKAIWDYGYHAQGALVRTAMKAVLDADMDEFFLVFVQSTPPYRVTIREIAREDLDAGAMETVFPWRPSDGHGETEESRHKLLEGLRAVRNPVMLIRLRPEDGAKVIKRKGQESFNYGDYYAYTKVCSHLGCPTSLFEQQTNRILCPCHQSQFNALEYAKPIFGPAARALAQLPLTVNNQGYLVAAGDFIEPVGPAFWERKS